MALEDSKEIREARARDSSYGEHLPQSWVAQRDRRLLLAEIDRLREAVSADAKMTWRHSDGTVRVDHMDARPGDKYGVAK